LNWGFVPQKSILRHSSARPGISVDAGYTSDRL
jgi:hypothetical protein